MTFAEEKTHEYIRHNYRNFRHIHAREILPYLGCLTISDQDRLRAELDRWGNADSLWKLFDSLRRRKGWVESLIQALRECEHISLAEDVARVYQSFQQPNTQEPSSPAGACGGLPNGFREEEASYSAPVQDTQTPQSLGQSSKTATQPHSSGTDQPGTGDQEPPAAMAARQPPTTRGQSQEQDKQPGSAHSAGGNPTPLRGPVSPTVSFQPLSRSTSRASRLPAPPGSGTGLPAPSPGVTLTGVPGDQAESTIWSRGIGLPSNSLPTSPVPSKVPINPKPLGTVPTMMPTGPTPSKLPVNSARVGAGAPKAPTGSVPDHRMPTNTVPRRGTGGWACTVPPRPSSLSQVPPARTGAHWNPEEELSKPGMLVSHIDSTFSGCSEDLAISRSDCSGTVGIGRHSPEENEYPASSIRVHVAENPSVDLLASNPGRSAAGTLQMEELPEKPPKPPGSWAPLLVMAAAGGLLVALLVGVLHRRHLLQ
ncbi:mitochondrial antiviral-signaling protein [Sorex fumeus]|uniref:mitochondrial antiviral-signaling protein n=1 Tax=Sorex fumeus TaxID=62283 RepID=UPI0024AD7E33|nr:mitochondrial antiviral-signaling protein [Sorex fumeus]